MSVSCRTVLPVALVTASRWPLMPWTLRAMVLLVSWIQSGLSLSEP
ncbi:hypothetical protein [Streptomyces sp. NPDC001833]